MADEPREDPPPDSVVPLHVLHVVDAEVYERFGRMFRQLGFALSNEGLRVSLLTDDAAAAADLDGTPVIDYHFRGFRGVDAWRLGAYLRREFDDPPSLVHLWGTAGAQRFSEWTRAVEIPLLIHATSAGEARRLCRRGLRPNEWPLAMCRHHAERFYERWPTVTDRIAVFAPAMLAPTELQPARAAGRTLGVVWSGRIEREGGLDLLVEAVRRLRARSVDLQAVLLGRGPATRWIWRQIRAQRVSDCISLAGGDGTWDHTVPGADIFVVPVCQQQISLAPVLAMSHGRVVIASGDQIADWFIEGETALYFTPGSAEELAQRIADVATGHPAARVVGRAAAAYVLREHAVTRLAARLREFYRAVVDTLDGTRRDPVERST